MVPQTQIRQKSNFRILRWEGAQKLRTYITKKTLKNFQFLTFGLGENGRFRKGHFLEKLRFSPLFHTFTKQNFRPKLLNMMCHPP